jgi:hypothetical protein
VTKKLSSENANRTNRTKRRFELNWLVFRQLERMKANPVLPRSNNMAILSRTFQANRGMRPSSEMPVDKKTKFYQHLTAYVLVIAGLAALNLTRKPDHLWFLWVAMGWGIGVTFHAVKAFFFRDNSSEIRQNSPDSTHENHSNI